MMQKTAAQQSAPGSSPEDVVAVYDRAAAEWPRLRDRRLIERRWLDRLLAAAPRGTGRRRILDLGCGSGQPVATYLADRGAEVTGVDASREMLRLFQQNLPAARAFHLDMRGLALGEEFDAILAWDSFFHLGAADQRAMMKVFADHAAPAAALLLTTGPDAGVEIGELAGEPLYHESLAPDDYRSALEEAGFRVLAFQAEDPDCAGRTVWLARRDDRLG